MFDKKKTTKHGFDVVGHGRFLQFLNENKLLLVFAWQNHLIMANNRIIVISLLWVDSNVFF